MLFFLFIFCLLYILCYISMKPNQVCKRYLFFWRLLLTFLLIVHYISFIRNNFSLYLFGKMSTFLVIDEVDTEQQLNYLIFPLFPFIIYVLIYLFVCCWTRYPFPFILNKRIYIGLRNWKCRSEGEIQNIIKITLPFKMNSIEWYWWIETCFLPC